MRQYFQLYPKERNQEWLMLTFAILSFLTIAKGTYNQFHNPNQDYILVPFVLIMFGCYFFVQSVNGLTKGNLVPKWTPFFIFHILCFLTQSIGSTTENKAKNFAKKVVGILNLLISITLFSTAIFYIITKS